MVKHETEIQNLILTSTYGILNDASKKKYVTFDVVIKQLGFFFFQLTYKTEKGK